MTDVSEDGEISEPREFLVDDDSLDIKPPQNQAGSKHKVRSRHSEHKRRDKHKHRRHESRRQRREHRERREARRPAEESRRPAEESRRPADESRRPADESRRPTDESRRAADDSRRPADDVRRPLDDARRVLDEARRPPPDLYEVHPQARPSRSREHRDRDRDRDRDRERDGRRERRGERELAPPEPRGHRESADELAPRERDSRHRQERREPPTEGDLRRERFLQAVRVSEYQKEMSKRELEARRQRRELEKQRQREVREIEMKREREYSGDRESAAVRRKRPRRAVVDLREESAERGRSPQPSPERPARDARQHRQAESEPSSEEDAEEEEDDEEGNGENDEESEESSSESETAGEEEQEQEEDAEEPADAVEAAASRSPTPPVTGRRWRQTSRSSPETASPRRAGSAAGSTPPPSPPPAADSPPPSPVELKEVLPPYLPAVQGCRNVEEFNCLNRIEEGTYGVVYRAIDKRTKEIVALKRLKMENEKEGFPITSLREINTLLKAQHENIVTVREIVVGSNMDKIYIVMDYVEHDLKSLMQTMKLKKQSFTTGEVKCLLIQMLRAVRHLHDNWILHRDLKTSNLLLSHKGVLKVGDFGLAREYGSPLKQYTPIVVTLWYRAPELLLGVKEYSCPVDMWSVGCIFGELVRMEPMFPGKSEADQINRIFKELGTPNEKIWPGYSELPAIKKMTFTEYPYNQLANKLAGAVTEKGVALMNKLLTYDPRRRLTADEALAHGYFDEQPRPIDPGMFPTWPAKSELGHKKTSASPKPPSGRKNLGDEDVGFQLGAAAGAGGFSLKF